MGTPQSCATFPIGGGIWRTAAVITAVCGLTLSAWAQPFPPPPGPIPEEAEYGYEEPEEFRPPYDERFLDGEDPYDETDYEPYGNVIADRTDEVEDFDSFDEIDVYDAGDYVDERGNEDWYEDFGYGGYASYGYGYEGYTYDYYDDAYTADNIYGGAFDYGVDEDRYYSDDWYADETALDRWYDGFPR